MSLAQAQEERAALVLGLEGHEEDLAGRLQGGVGDGAQPRPGHAGGEEGVLLGTVVAHTLVHVVGGQDGACEPGPGPGVLEGEAGTGQQAHAAVLTGGGEAAGSHVQGVRPGGGHEVPGLVTHEGGGQAVLGGGPREGEAVLVRDPLLVDRRVVAGHAAQDHATARVHADGGAGGVVLGDRVGGHQVHGPGAEAVAGRGQRPHGADLDDVAGEVRGEGPPGDVQVRGRGAGSGPAEGAGGAVRAGQVRVRREAVGAPQRVGTAGLVRTGVEEVKHLRVETADLLAEEASGVAVGSRVPAAATLEVDEGVAGDLLGKTDAALAQDAAVTVQEDLAGQAQRLGEGALDVRETGDGLGAGGHELERLVLQGALAALVADGAVQGVVDEEELHGAGLCLGGHGAGDLGGDLHPGRHGHGAGGLRLGHGAHHAVASRHRDLHEALAAAGRRRQEGVVAEAGNPYTGLLGGADDERAPLHGDGRAVHGDGDEVAGGCHLGLCHLWLTEHLP